MGRLIQLSIIIMLALLSTQGHAGDQDRALQLRETGEVLPLERILEISRQQIDGRILEVELEQEHDQIIYELEILDAEGRVWELKVDARTGDVIKHEQE